MQVQGSTKPASPCRSTFPCPFDCMHSTSQQVLQPSPAGICMTKARCGSLSETSQAAGSADTLYLCVKLSGADVTYGCKRSTTHLAVLQHLACILGHAGCVVGCGAARTLDHILPIARLTAHVAVVLRAPEVGALLGHLSQLELVHTPVGSARQLEPCMYDTSHVHID